MEMMVVLTIVAIVAAASAPMVNRKMVRSAAGAGSPWEWVNGIPGNPIFYNHERNNNQTASIGSEVAPNNEHPRLYIDSTDDTVPHIMFGRNNDNNSLMRLFAGGANSNIWLSNSNMPNGLRRSVVIGDANGAGAHTSAISIGENADIRGDMAIAIGGQSNAEGNCVALGRQADSRAQNSVSIGRESATVANNSVAIGYQPQSTAINAISIGSQPQSLAVNSISIGSQASSTAANGIAIGSPVGNNNANRTLANAADTIAIGTNARALRQNSIAIGRGAVVSPNNAAGSSSIAIGNGARTNHDDTIVIGRDTTSAGSGAIALGFNTSAATNAIAIGTSRASGVVTQASAANSIAIGQNAGANANASNGIAIGQGATVSAANAVAIGRGSSSTADNTIVIGIDAISNPSNTSSTQSITKTIVLGDANTRVIIPGTVSFQNIAVRGSAFINDDIYVGKRAYLGLNMRTKGSKCAVGKGDTSLIMASVPKDDNENNWVKDGHSKNGHSVWQFYGLTRIEEKEGSKLKNPSMVALIGNKVDDTPKFGKNLLRENKSIDTVVNDAIKLLNAQVSDRRLKNVGKEFAAGLAELKKLDLYHFTYKEDEYKTPHVGVMAQDLQKIFPDAVRKGEDGFLRIRMEDMFYAVINAVKELDSRLSVLEQKQKKIDELEKRVEKLEKRLEALEKAK